jgi:type IV pilus assembly protein PilN
MAKINLLPWRAERRKQRQQEFMTMLGLAAAAGVLISLLIVMYYIGQIDGQNNRNKYLTDEIAKLDTQIAEIAELDKKKEGLLKRKQVIEELQASRSQMVHLFDELARTIADGTQITSLAQNGDDLTLLGRAQSNARVSSYMRNLDASGWMGNPELDIIELRGSDPSLPNEFSLKVKLKNPNEATPAGSEPLVDTGAPAPMAPADGSAPAPAATSSVAAPAATAPGAAPAAGVVPPAAPAVDPPAAPNAAPPTTESSARPGTPTPPAAGGKP